MHLPYQTQAVGKADQAVTEASAILCADTAREIFIKAQIDMKKTIPKFHRKR